PVGPAPARSSWAWLGVVPFVLYVAAFLFFPAASILTQSFLDDDRRLTLRNVANLADPQIAASYVYTIQLSAASAVGGGLLGLLLAYAVSVGGLPRGIRAALLSFCGVASNFAGIPLAFAFIATLGNLGLVNWLLGYAGLNLRALGFNLYSFWGLVLTYVYFQIPLMVLAMVPTLDGLRREWREAAESLGASSVQYWRYVGLPVLLPAVLATMVLLFGNAFGAHATAFALTGGGNRGTVVTVLIGAQLSGDMKPNPGLGNALALG